MKGGTSLIVVDPGMVVFGADGEEVGEVAWGGGGAGQAFEEAVGEFQGFRVHCVLNVKKEIRDC